MTPRLLEQPPQAMPGSIGELYFLAMPIATFRALSDAAARKGLTFAQLMQRAIEHAISDRG